MRDSASGARPRARAIGDRRARLRSIGAGRVLLLTTSFAALLAAAGCPRPCESSANCKRTCQCIDAQTQVRNDCTLAFRCEGATQTCEDDFSGLSCDDICGRFAARGECGFERCAADAECTKHLSCPVLGADGNPVADQHFDCTLTFVCDQDQGLCEVASTASVDQMCAVCRQQAGG